MKGWSLLWAVPLAAAALLLGGARVVNGWSAKIRAEKGVQWAGYLTIGGIEQYIQVRGNNRENPVLLVLHGGPGSPMAYGSREWQSGLEGEYTLVHWDQRGCGNTYYRNPGAPPPTVEGLISDLDELVDFLCTGFRQEQVILMGHSWGTFLGGLYASRHPDKLAAYLAVSQMADFRMSERSSTREAIRRAREAGRAEEAERLGQELERIMDLKGLDGADGLALVRFRRHKERYLPPQYSGETFLSRLTAPELTLGRLRWMFRMDRLLAANQRLYESLLAPEGPSRYESPLHYEVPVVLVAGEQDWTTPYLLACEYVRTLSAPYKELISLADTGHLPFLERPEAFVKAVRQALERCRGQAQPHD